MFVDVCEQRAGDTVCVRVSAWTGNRRGDEEGLM